MPITIYKPIYIEEEDLLSIDRISIDDEKTDLV